MTAFFLAASDVEELLGSLTDSTLLPSSSSRNYRLRVDEELICIMTKAVNELATAGPPRKQPLMCCSRPRLTLGAEESVLLVTAVIADKIKHIFSKREQKYFSAYHKCPALMQPVFTSVSTPCHACRGLAGHPRCVSVGNDCGQ